VARGEKLLARMRANPGDWRIEDVETICNAFGLEFRRKTGSHATISHSKVREILTVPARRPIKPLYIVRLVLFIDAVIGMKS